MRGRGFRRASAAVLAVLAATGAAAADPDRDAGGYLGVVIGVEAREISARTGGRLVAVDVRIGDRVQAGDSLARLDDRSARRALAIAETALDVAQAALRKAEADRSIAQGAHERRQVAPELFSEQEILVSREQANAAAAQAEGAAAAVREAHLNVEQARQDLAATRLVSPVSGIVAARLKEPGMLVETGAVVARVSGEGDRWVRFAVPPGEIDGLPPGSAVEVRPADHDAGLRAIVRQVAPEADDASGMVFAEAILEADGARVPAGGVVRVFPVTR